MAVLAVRHDGHASVRRALEAAGGLARLAVGGGGVLAFGVVLVEERAVGTLLREVARFAVRQAVVVSGAVGRVGNHSGRGRRVGADRGAVVQEHRAIPDGGRDEGETKV